MRLAAVSIVKNEADIIEAFVRHTLAWVDHHLIFDHDSTDGTREILGALKREGLPITLYTDEAIGNLQDLRSNHLTQLAAQSLGADWILPLDADEILTGPGRASLEKSLATLATDRPASIPLVNYYPTSEDDPAQSNPVLRLRYCQPSAARTKKVMVPRQLALELGVTAGKGSHVLYRDGTPLPDQPLPEDFFLAHLALRSPQHQVLRVVLAELQKLSRGRSHAGLDEHYRLGFQLLAEDPDLFFATVRKPVGELRLQPIEYSGGGLHSGKPTADWNRIARALLPFLEKLAVSHGRLTDTNVPTSNPDTAGPIRELTLDETGLPYPEDRSGEFTGFVPESGWGDTEGPVPEAFLPPFHWGFAPTTRLVIQSAAGHSARLVADALTYTERQTMRVELNGVPILTHTFSRINQKDRLSITLPLAAGRNELSLHYSRHLATDYDPRQLAVIFLSLRVVA